MKRARMAVLAAAVALASAAEAQEGKKGIVLSSTVTCDLAAASVIGDSGAEAPQWGQTARIELRAINADRSFAKAEAAVEAGLVRGIGAEAAKAEALKAATAAGLPAGAAGLLSSIDALPTFALRKLYVQLDFGPVLVSAGRQIVNRGRGQYFSPVDLFSESDGSLVSPRRTGSDSVNVLAPLGDLGGFELTARPETDFGRGLYQARAFGNALGADGAASAAFDGTRKLWLFGADLKFDLGAAFFAETLVACPEDFSSARSVVMGGVDWSLDGAWFAGAEYRFDSSPTSPSLPSASGFPSTHAVMAYLAFSPADNAQARLALVANADRGTGLLSLSAAWSPAQGTTVTPWAAYARGSLARDGADDGISGGITMAVRM